MPCKEEEERSSTDARSKSRDKARFGYALQGGGRTQFKGNIFFLNNKIFCVKFTQDGRFSIETTTIHCLFSIFFFASHANIDYSISIIP